MTVLREWAGGFCAAGIACALLGALCPKGAMQQAFGVLTALLMLCSLLSPVQLLVSTLQNGVVAPTDELAVPQALSETAQKQALSIIEQALYKDALERLGEEKVTLKRLYAQRDNQEDGRIYIQKVRLVFDKADRPVDPQVIHRLSAAWGVPTEVYYEG